MDPAEYLRQFGEAGEGPHDIARAALMLAALDHAGRALAPYEPIWPKSPKRAEQRSRLCCLMPKMARARWRR